MLFAALAMPLSATEQMLERLTIDGKVYEMKYVPLWDLDTTLQRRIEACIDEAVPNAERSTGLWRGYIGCWSISDGCLYLDSLCIPDWEDWKLSAYDPDKVRGILSDYCHDGRIRADWFTRDSVCLVVPGSELLSYAHLGFSSRFSEEVTCSFRNGILRSLTYRNYVFHKGIRWRSRFVSLCDSFPRDQFPQLKGRGSLEFLIRDIRVDENGRMIDCDLPMRGDALKGLENVGELEREIREIVKRMILSVDWELYEWEGAYTLGQGATFQAASFPVFFRR